MENTAVRVHKDFFDRVDAAIEAGFFLEALVLEYAAIEGRLEILCGLYSLPCNKDAPDDIRKDIKISHRIACLKAIYLKRSGGNKSKIKTTGEFWKQLQAWTVQRNQYIHGLYKNTEKYSARNTEIQKQAKIGREYSEILYKEVKRIRYAIKHHPEIMCFDGKLCRKKGCRAFQDA